MTDVYKIMEEYNPGKKRKVLIVFYDMIIDVTSNKKLHPAATDPFTRGCKLNIYLVFITQSCFRGKRRKIKHYILPHYQNFKLTRALTNFH